MAAVIIFYFISIIYTYTEALDQVGMLPSLEEAETEGLRIEGSFHVLSTRRF